MWKSVAATIWLVIFSEISNPNHFDATFQTETLTIKIQRVLDNNHQAQEHLTRNLRMGCDQRMPESVCVCLGCGNVTKYSVRRPPVCSSASQSSPSASGPCLDFTNFVLARTRQDGAAPINTCTGVTGATGRATMAI